MTVVVHSVPAAACSDSLDLWLTKWGFNPKLAAV